MMVGAVRLTVLGTSAPYPVAGTACSGYLLQSPAGTTVWIDAGTGTLAELQKYIPLVDVDAIWISHRHADHTADLLVAFYALRYSALRPGRRMPLIAPQGLAARLADYLGPGSAEELESVFEVTELNGWGEADLGDLDLSWGPVLHGVPAWALTVTHRGGEAESGESSGRAGFTYSGDAAPCMSLVEMAESSSTLLCEVGYDREALGEEPVHHTPEDAGRTAAAAGVQTLILTHVSDELSPADAVRRASAEFSGTVLLAEAGATFEV